MYNEIKTIEVSKLNDNSLRLLILGKLELTLTEDESRDLFYELAHELDYEVRSKW